MKLKLDQLIVTNNPAINARNEPTETLQDLQSSMATSGLRMAVKVMASDHNDLYELVRGFRRYEAARRLGWIEIEVTIIDSWPDDMIGQLT